MVKQWLKRLFIQVHIQVFKRQLQFMARMDHLRDDLGRCKGQVSKSEERHPLLPARHL